MTRPAPSNHRELFEFYAQAIGRNLSPRSHAERVELLVDLRGLDELVGHLREHHASLAAQEQNG